VGIAAHFYGVAHFPPLFPGGVAHGELVEPGQLGEISLPGVHPAVPHGLEDRCAGLFPDEKDRLVVAELLTTFPFLVIVGGTHPPGGTVAVTPAMLCESRVPNIAGLRNRDVVAIEGREAGIALSGQQHLRVGLGAHMNGAQPADPRPGFGIVPEGQPVPGGYVINEPLIGACPLIAVKGIEYGGPKGMIVHDIQEGDDRQGNPGDTHPTPPEDHDGGQEQGDDKGGDSRQQIHVERAGIVDHREAAVVIGLREAHREDAPFMIVSGEILPEGITRPVIERRRFRSGDDDDVFVSFLGLTNRLEIIHRFSLEDGIQLHGLVDEVGKRGEAV